MSDPLRTDPSRVIEPASEADAEAKIEQLLLAGLEHYFESRYEQAINIWTRALFFDRGHARARAYIERARSAQAERQRESEELLQRGIAAFARGEGDEARRLLEAAMDQGAPSDQALAILERLNRLAQVTPPAAQMRPVGRHVPSSAATIEPASRASRAAWTALGFLALVIVAAGAFAAGAFRSDWRPLLARPSALLATPPRTVTDEGLPLPRRGEAALARARALAQGGRLHDALAALDAVRATDTQRVDADHLRADIQKQLIALGDAHAP